MGEKSKAAKQNVLFVCIGNACRSQMAEALAHHQGNGKVRAWSAGSAPLGSIAEGTEAVLAEKGISLAGHYSKGLEDIPLKEMDVIVTMGCEVACTTFPGFRGRTVEWEIPDPYGEGLERFREVRDIVESEVAGLLQSLIPTTG